MRNTLTETELATKKALCRQAAVKAAEALKGIHTDQGAPTIFEAASTRWRNAEKGDTVPTARPALHNFRVDSRMVA